MGVAHAVLAQLGPPLAPQVIGGVGGVNVIQLAGDTLAAGSYASRLFAHPEHHVAVVSARGAAAVDVPWFPQGHLDVRGYAAHLPFRPNYLPNQRVIPAVLQRNKVAVGLNVPLDEVGRPLGIVGLHGDEGKVEGFGDALGVGKVHGLDRHGKVALAAAGPQALGPHGLHVLGPHINEGNVLASLG